MNLNIASQHQGLIAWSALAGPVNPGIDIRQHNGFSFTFNVDSDITADAVFEVRSAPPLPTDNCMGDVANASDIPEVMMCAMPGQIAAPKSQIIIPPELRRVRSARLPFPADQTPLLRYLRSVEILVVSPLLLFSPVPGETNCYQSGEGAAGRSDSRPSCSSSRYGSRTSVRLGKRIRVRSVFSLRS